MHRKLPIAFFYFGHENFEILHANAAKVAGKVFMNLSSALIESYNFSCILLLRILSRLENRANKVIIGEYI